MGKFLPLWPNLWVQIWWESQSILAMILIGSTHKIQFLSVNCISVTVAIITTWIKFAQQQVGDTLNRVRITPSTTVNCGQILTLHGKNPLLTMVASDTLIHLELSQCDQSGKNFHMKVHCILNWSTLIFNKTQICIVCWSNINALFSTCYRHGTYVPSYWSCGSRHQYSGQITIWTNTTNARVQYL